MLGYVAIGLPCGILEDSIGMNWFQALVLSLIFYSGAGQFMICNMWLAASPVASIIASVSLVNTRQMLYSASFAPLCKGASKLLSFLFAATVTDESYGVNMREFSIGGWTVGRATLVNLLSCLSWSVSNAIGVLLGAAIGIPLAIASFAMTSIFICLLSTQKMSFENVAAIVVSMAGVFVCKAIGLGGAAILVGALLGVAAAFVVWQMRGKPRGRKLASNQVAGNTEEARL